MIVLPASKPVKAIEPGRFGSGKRLRTGIAESRCQGKLDA